MNREKRPRRGREQELLKLYQQKHHACTVLDEDVTTCEASIPAS